MSRRKMKLRYINFFYATDGSYCTKLASVMSGHFPHGNKYASVSL